jgi:hypothetical protein
MKSYLTTHNPQPATYNLQPTTKKTIALITALCILLQAIAPTASHAITGGPNAPEFSSFDPVGNTEMVNHFSGDFTYNIPVLNVPGPHGSGYSLSLAYNSGLNPEEDAGWVGYGWSLNPGAINRNKKGFADDVKAGDATFYNKMPSVADVEVAFTAGADMRVFGAIKHTEGLISASANLGASITTGMHFNSETGLVINTTPYIGYGLGFKAGPLKLHGAIDNTPSEKDFGYELSKNPMDYVMTAAGIMTVAFPETFKTIGSEMKKNIGKVQKLYNKYQKLYNKYNVSQYSGFLSKNTTLTYNFMEFSGNRTEFSYGLHGTPTSLPIGIGASVYGAFGTQDYTAYNGKQIAIYGFCHTAEAYDEQDVMMDYLSERNTFFDANIKFLPIPFSCADDFLVSGQDIGGAFRAYASNAFHVSPSEQKGQMEYETIPLFSVHLNLGLNSSISTTTNSGSFSRGIKEWGSTRDNNSDYLFKNEGFEPYFFRFMGDQGGYIDYGDDAQRASLKGSGSNGYYPECPGLENKDNNTATGRSSYIGFHTISQMLEKDGNNKYFNRFSYRTDIENQLENDDDDNYKNQIGEFSITNKNGSSYIYGLPVYAKDESFKQLGFDECLNDNEKYIVYQNISSPEKEFGQLISTAYATSWLLTEVRGSNYIDRTYDGPTSDDFGAWTKFSYKKIYGYDKNDWYKWRNPYIGLMPEPGNISNLKDDLVSYSSGKTEKYYLQYIETQTHKAVFELSDREDGYSALDDDGKAAETEDVTGIDVNGVNPLKKLDKITLYVKNEDGSTGEVIQRIYFEYDYSLMSNLPNNINTIEGDTNNTGKLTLKKVRIENANVHNAQNPEFEFVYEYPDENYFPESVTDKYGASSPNESERILDFGEQFSSDDENPDYGTGITDRWGNYRIGRSYKNTKFSPWLDQYPDDNFDPAAWHLKAIKLPGKGEIHVQYEQDEYGYVQNHKAMSMVNISEIISCPDTNTACEFSETTGTSEEQGGTGDYFKLNLDRLGIDPDSSVNDKKKVTRIYNHMRNIFLNGVNGRKPERMYFKFLYNIEGNTANYDDADNKCHYEYIEGYSKVQGVILDKDTWEIWVKLGKTSADSYSSPREICRDFYKSQKGQLSDGDCENTIAFSDFLKDDDEEFTYNNIDFEAVINEMLDLSPETEDDAGGRCMKMDTVYSYLRIPVADEKKGGGVRVKRLFMYDPGMESDAADAQIYGKEYFYSLWKNDLGESCSGVASSEPDEGMEENALIGFLRDLDPDDKLGDIAAEERKKFYSRGPLGETILPAPSVGYSRVVEVNIHKGHTKDGIYNYEFYTNKDYPSCKVSYTSKNTETNTDKPNISFFDNYLKYYAWSTQGYSFVLNGMNGVPSRNAVYAGDYADINDPDELIEINGTAYNYFEPGEDIPVMTAWGETSSMPLGKSSEVIAESKNIYEKEERHPLTIDAGFAIWPLPPTTIPYILPLPYNVVNKTDIYTHVINKVSYYPPIVKSVTNFQDGTYSTLQNLYFNPLTGEPIITQTSGLYDQLDFGNGEVHNGKITNVALPATFFYDDMGQKAGFEGYTTSADDVSIKKTYTQGEYGLNISGSGSSKLFAKLNIGDMIALCEVGEKTECYYVESVAGYLASTANGSMPDVTLIPTSGLYSYTQNNNDGFALSIIRSSRTNQLSINSDQFSVYGSFNPADAEEEVSDEQWEYRQAFADYLNKKLNDETVYQNDFKCLSYVNTAGNCQQCTDDDCSSDDENVDDFNNFGNNLNWQEWETDIKDYFNQMDQYKDDLVFEGFLEAYIDYLHALETTSYIFNTIQSQTDVYDMIEQDYSIWVSTNSQQNNQQAALQFLSNKYSQ